MRRLIIIGTAAAVLVGAAAAFAAFNNYNGSSLAFTKGKGTKTKPVSVKLVEKLKANSPPGKRAAPLIDIKLAIYGLKTNGGKLPKCTDAMIENAGSSGGYDKACPKGSLIATGPVHALLGPASDPSSSTPPAVPCNPFLHVYNGGAKTQVFFFTTDATHQCGGLTTGQTAPYDGHISTAGKVWKLDVPLPPDVSNKVANQQGLYGSLITEQLTYPKGKYGQSVACKGSKRPWAITLTAQDYGGGTETSTVKGSSKC